MPNVYLIASPIGSKLSDISIGAVRILKKTENILTENEGSKLVQRLKAKGIISQEAEITQIPYDENEIFPFVDQLIAQGKDFAILANEGLPCFVDPGTRIVSHIRGNPEVELVPVGMNSAIQAAFLLTGIRFRRFTFLGHYPSNPLLKDSIEPLIMYVRCGHLKEFLDECSRLMDEKQIVTIIANATKPKYWKRQVRVEEISIEMEPILTLVSPNDSFVAVISENEKE